VNLGEGSAKKREEGQKRGKLSDEAGFLEKKRRSGSTWRFERV